MASGDLDYWSLPARHPRSQFTLDPTGNGSAGLLTAAGLDISNASIDFATLGSLDDSTYVIADYTALTGSAFASVRNLPSDYSINYSYNQGTQVAVVETVPEPSTWAMLAGGWAALFGLRRRKG